MKSIKFKKNKFGLKEKIIFSVFCSFSLCSFMTYRITSSMTDKILDVADKLIKKENNLKLKEAFSKRNVSNNESEKLFEVIKNSNEEIVEIDFNIPECERVMKSIIDHIDKSNKSINEDGYIIFIPLGYLSDSPILINLGPMIPISTKTMDTAMGNVKTVIREYGINNALIEIYIEIAFKIDTIMPLEKREQDLTYESLIASKIVMGKIPSFYGGSFTKESSMINLPIDE